MAESGRAAQNDPRYASSTELADLVVRLRFEEEGEAAGRDASGAIRLAR